MDEQPQSEQPMSNPAAMVDLLEHLLHEYWGYRGGRGGGEQPQLLPGEIPSQLPVEIPLPGESRIVGSVLWSASTTVILDCALNQEEAIRFYDERLTSLGWTKPEMGLGYPFGGGGFTNKGGPWDDGAQFCLGERGPSLHVRTIIASNEPTSTSSTSIHIALNTDPELSPCSPRLRRQMGMMHLQSDILPKLEPPQGAMQLGGGSSGGGDTATSRGWLTTDLDLSTAHTHYKDQLQKNGWGPIDSGENGPVAWSTWDFQYEDEGWHGMMMVIAHPWSKGGYQVSLYAEIEGYGRHGGIVFRNGFF